MTEPGLRARKKQQTRRLIAETAARLFAEAGYENVAVIDVARAADVAEQTVYNYFPTKEHLVLDQADALRDRLVALILDRPPGVTPAAAIKDEALAYVAGNASLPIEQIRGGLGHLATLSPGVRRLCLEMTDHLADAIAPALLTSTDIDDPGVAKLHAIALAWVFQTITDHTGRYAHQGHTPKQIADQLRPTITAMLDDLDQWPTTRPPTSNRKTRRERPVRR
ncbi:MAG: TetR/AcrR family transcriptional regulator [Nocardioidaceae bacterium]